MHTFITVLFGKDTLCATLCGNINTIDQHTSGGTGRLSKASTCVLLYHTAQYFLPNMCWSGTCVGQEHSPASLTAGCP